MPTPNGKKSTDAPSRRSRRSAPDMSGLADSLLQGVSETFGVGDHASVPEGARLPVDRLKPSKEQSREIFSDEDLEELAATIRKVGIIQPIQVRPLNDKSGRETHEIVAGERRWRAAKLAGEKDVPVITYKGTVDPALVGLIENLQRQNLHPMEEAQALEHLRQKNSWDHEELARAVGKTGVWVSETLGLVRLSKQIQNESKQEPHRRWVSRSLLIEISREGLEEQAQLWEYAKAHSGGVSALRERRRGERASRDVLAFTQRFVTGVQSFRRSLERFERSVGKQDLSDQDVAPLLDELQAARERIDRLESQLRTLA